MSGFYIGLAIKAALVAIIAALKERRSATLIGRSEGARRAKAWAYRAEGISSLNEKIRTVQGDVLQ